MANGFGVLLRDARSRAGMTQEDLSHRSGVGVRTIRRLETGSGNDPRIGTVTMLADALQVTPEQRRGLLAAADGRDAGDGKGGAGGEPVVPKPVRRGLPSVPAEVSAAADNLARVVAAQLQREEEQRRVPDPFPLPVRWRQAPEHLSDHWDNICRVPAGMTATPLDLAGEVTDVAAAYGRIPSRRMVVLGRAGSGKTVLTLRFVLDTLAARQPDDAVPVVFSVGSWNPTTTPLRTWLVSILQRDHPGLAAAAPGGSTLAAVLVDTGRILPVLDGFDEIAAGLHRPALEALNALSMPLLLTSRFDEYERAVTEVDVLTSAAVVELADLTPDDLAAYLPRTSRRTADGTAWDPVIAALQDTAAWTQDTTARAADTAAWTQDTTAWAADTAAAERLAAVLVTPLMVSLARTVYSDSPGRDPADLLDETRFPSEAAIAGHLLDSFVPTVYAGHERWEVPQVQRWLGFLADDLRQHGMTDLAWWRLGLTVSPRKRLLMIVGATALTAAMVIWFLYSPAIVLIAGTQVNVLVSLLDGVLEGPVFAVPIGLLYYLMVLRKDRVLEPTRARLRWLDRASRPPRFWHKLGRRFSAGVLGGAIAGAVYALVAAVIRSVSPNFPSADLATVLRTAAVDSIGYAVTFGLACGIVLALGFAIEAPANLTTATSPADLLAANRTTVLRMAGLLVVTLAIGIAALGYLVTAVMSVVGMQSTWGPLGLLLGVTAGLGAVFGYVMAFTAWGHWLLFARLRLPLTGKLPWAVDAFLEDAYRRGVLRQSGAVYQFRHARLLEHYAQTYRP